MERICGICSHIHATAYVLGVEKLWRAWPFRRGRRPSARSSAEMERIHSHLLWLGVAAHEAGFDTLFMYSWRDRETIMDLLEELSGNRVNYSVNLLGGVKYDIDAKGADSLRRGLDFLEKRTQHYLKIVTTRRELPPPHARAWAPSPSSRPTSWAPWGPPRAHRGSRGTFAWRPRTWRTPTSPCTTVLDTRCDLEARFVVRINELFESYRLVREILDKLPAGRPCRRLHHAACRRARSSAGWRRRAGSCSTSSSSSGGVKPDRVKVRTPSLCNWAAVLSVAVGHKLADIPMIMVGIDPCFSCNDRSITRRGAAAETECWTWEDLQALRDPLLRRGGA